MAKRWTNTANAKIYEAKKVAGVSIWQIADESWRCNINVTFGEVKRD